MAIRNAALLVLAALNWCAGVCADQRTIDIQFRDGRVWMVANAAPVQDILREWARIGGATIVNGDAVEGPPITLQLSGVPEPEALDAVLHGTAGYVGVVGAPEADGPSRLKRIVILPTSAVVNAGAPAASGRFDQPEDDQHSLPALLEAVVRSGLAGAATTIDQGNGEMARPLDDIIRSLRDSQASTSTPRPRSEPPQR